jgi:hypothetical protein
MQQERKLPLLQSEIKTSVGDFHAAREAANVRFVAPGALRTFMVGLRYRM